MNFKKFLTYLKSKGVEPTADELTDFLDEQKTSKPNDTPIVPDYSQLQHNAKAIQELKETFEKQLSSKDDTIKELTSKLENFMNESLKDKEERAAREKAHQEQLEAAAKEKLAKEVDLRINNLVGEGKIAPKDEKLIARLKTMDLEAIDDIASGLPIISGTNNKDGNKPINNDAKATSEFDLLTSGISQSIRDSIAKTIN